VALVKAGIPLADAQLIAKVVYNYTLKQKSEAYNLHSFILIK